MHIVYANVHSRAFALLALITRLPSLGGNLPFAKRPISDHSEPIPNLHGTPELEDSVDNTQSPP